MILTPKEFAQHHHEIGGKTITLKSLQDAGISVPEFIAVPTSVVKNLLDAHGIPHEKSIIDLAKEITNIFPQTQYAVRSSALIEDSKEHSFAGQFKTKIDQSPDQLAAAITEVITHAYHFLGGNLDQFSLLLQKYILADYAGITFTRHPISGREMVFEYHQGIGETIVGGEIKPEKLALYWTQPCPSSALPDFENAVETCKKIESLFGAPQDIEWCIQNDTWHFLQARPITTRETSDFEQDKYLDHLFAKRSAYLLEKTEISEIAQRPTPMTFSILKDIYSANGPIQKTYASYGITYNPLTMLEIVGNELYVNREEEIKTILPSYSYLKNLDGKPHFSRISGIWTTMKNLWNLQRIKTNSSEKILEKIKNELENVSFVNASLKEKRMDFMKAYECIFEINLLTQKALSSLEFALSKEKISPAEALTIQCDDDKKYQIDIPSTMKNLTGNALEIRDESPFAVIKITTQENGAAKEWLNNLPSWKKPYFLPIISHAKNFSTLREYGRWLTVAHINALRKSITGAWKNPKLMYFATIDEALKNTLDEEELLRREKIYEQYAHFHLPKRLSYAPIQDTAITQGVSVGKANGILVDKDHINDVADPILYTEILSPDLAPYLPSLKGIISQQGGLLSHLAIVARESSTPVIVNANIAYLGLSLGDRVEIDGSTGVITPSM